MSKYEHNQPHIKLSRSKWLKSCFSNYPAASKQNFDLTIEISRGSKIFFVLIIFGLFLERQLWNCSHWSLNILGVLWCILMFELKWEDMLFGSSSIAPEFKSRLCCAKTIFYFAPLPLEQHSVCIVPPNIFAHIQLCSFWVINIMQHLGWKLLRLTIRCVWWFF